MNGQCPVEPNPPLPQQLSHLSEMDWHLVSQLLRNNLQMRDQLPIQ